ncbi:MAG: hypothetical protein MZW92_66365 [Comamonadaceae bacterium]|nr:hypothetical protein [Comamonadaceae bacterium]
MRQRSHPSALADLGADPLRARRLQRAGAGPGRRAARSCCHRPRGRVPPLRRRDGAPRRAAGARAGAQQPQRLV